MIMPVVQAYVGEITPQGKEGYSMGMFNMSMFASLSLGPLMGGIIQDAFSMNAAFACMGILSGVGLGLSLWFLPPVHNEYIKHKERPPVPWKLLIVDRGLLGLFAYRFFYTACIGIIWCFLPILSDIKFSLPGSSTGILLMLAVLVSGLLQMPMGFLADRINKRLMVVSGGTICAAAMVMLFYSDSYSHLIRAVSVFGVGGGISMPAVMALSIIKGQEKCSLASVMSVVTVAHSFGMMVGSMAAGLAMDYLELEYVFPCGAAMIIFGIFLFFGLTIPYRKA